MKLFREVAGLILTCLRRAIALVVQRILTAGLALSITTLVVQWILTAVMILLTQEAGLIRDGPVGPRA